MDGLCFAVFMITREGSFQACEWTKVDAGVGGNLVEVGGLQKLTMGDFF